ncbi:MAG: hypothetical protein AABY22_01730 [Nanoarchaeota archaeon]
MLFYSKIQPKDLYSSMYYTYYMVDYIKKTITITKEQAEWIKEKSINLSRFVQSAIDKSKKSK